MNKNKAVLEVRFKGLGAATVLLVGMSWLAGMWSGYCVRLKEEQDEE